MRTIASYACQLRAARPVLGERGRLIVAFQPHLYSRTRIFAERFAQALSGADHVVLAGIYGAREDPDADHPLERGRERRREARAGLLAARAASRAGLAVDLLRDGPPAATE